MVFTMRTPESCWLFQAASQSLSMATTVSVKQRAKGRRCAPALVLTRPRRGEDPPPTGQPGPAVHVCTDLREALCSAPVGSLNGCTDPTAGPYAVVIGLYHAKHRTGIRLRSFRTKI